MRDWFRKHLFKKHGVTEFEMADRVGVLLRDYIRAHPADPEVTRQLPRIDAVLWITRPGRLFPEWEARLEADDRVLTWGDEDPVAIWDRIVYELCAFIGVNAYAGFDPQATLEQYNVLRAALAELGIEAPDMSEDGFAGLG